MALFLAVNLITHAQGCSDAGFCTLPGLKPKADTTTYAYMVKVGSNIGGADNNISVWGTYAELSARLREKAQVHAKVSTLAQSGNGISVNGFSDIYLNVSYQASPTLSFLLGSKLPLTNGNRRRNNLPLPIDYQASLGTWDAIAGVSYNLSKWQFMWALQQPITQNKNEFNAEDYPIESALRNFQTTNNYTRKGDMLFRIAYPVLVRKKIKVTPSLLSIYHLGNDTYQNEFGSNVAISNSEGLTINATVFFDMPISKKSALQLNGGIPFVVREARPDGLTRSYVLNLEYQVKF
ncbi:MAG: hypothetical protein MUE72_01405 [Chitinophagaceae bacterium]|nr:hypothetical protein [Chitinophagaceae bacterium]